MTNPDRQVHANETCWVVITALVVLALLASVILSIVAAYQP